MKKITKILACVMALCCMFATCTIFTSASLVSGRFQDSRAVYTSVTNTRGYIYAYYTGEYGSNEYARISAECDGGSVSGFKTSLYMKLTVSATVRDEVSKNSDSTGSRSLNGVIQRPANEINSVVAGIGYVEETCISKTNSSDKWLYLSTYQWVGAQQGWVER